MKTMTDPGSSSGGRLSGRLWLIAAQVCGTLMMLIAIAIMATAAGAAQPQPFPLDKYPGFGRSPLAAQRDDTIAAWEAFRREQLIASCLGRAGFSYVPALAFPEEPLAAVASSLGISAVGAATARSPFDQNQAYEATLSASEDERYSRTLYGESAIDMAGTGRTGQVPTGRESDFASGGCRGEAKSVVPSVWDLKRGLEGELELMRQNIAAAPEMVTTGDAYAACARVRGMDARSPADVERIAVINLSTAITAVLKECNGVWAAGYRTAELAVMTEFERRNLVVLRSAEARYVDVPAGIAADVEFRAYLAQYSRAGH